MAKDQLSFEDRPSIKDRLRGRDRPSVRDTPGTTDQARTKEKPGTGEKPDTGDQPTARSQSSVDKQPDAEEQPDLVAEPAKQRGRRIGRRKTEARAEAPSDTDDEYVDWVKGLSAEPPAVRLGGTRNARHARPGDDGTPPPA